MLVRRLAPLVAALALLPARPADACQVLRVDLTPTDDLQMVIWLEDGAGRFIETLYITRATGSWGLGNRPGIMELNDQYLWPYGRRESTFPVWAHRHGVSYPRIVFQNGDEVDVSHPFSQSSPEGTYCRPMLSDEAVLERSLDSGTCATSAYTDKGKFATEPPLTSSYPPRNDIVRRVTNGTGPDHADVAQFAMVNDLDAVSRATPPGGVSMLEFLPVPSDLPDGDYVVWVEVSKSGDRNASYAYPSLDTIPYADYGEAYRGQPSVVWRLPIALPGDHAMVSALDYFGYGDPDGLDGEVREPDPTITTGVEGSGSQRLLLNSGPDGMYRVRVGFQPGNDPQAPGDAGELELVAVSGNAATLSFVEPGDDGMVGAASRLEVRYSIGTEMTAADFTSATMADAALVPGGAGTLQTVTLNGLRPETNYWVGVRAYDDCLNGSTPQILHIVTPRFEGGEVSTCFVATAAWGSPLQQEVSLLRRFRDRALRKVAIGEILVESYYTFGPGLAALIRPSDPLRSLARTALGPVVSLVRETHPE
jgi:hypothetical protein